MSMIKGRLSIPVSQFWEWLIDNGTSDYGHPCQQFPQTDVAYVDPENDYVTFKDVDGVVYRVHGIQRLREWLKRYVPVDIDVYFGTPFIDASKLYCDYVAADHPQEFEYQWEAIRVRKRYNMTRFKPLSRGLQQIDNFMHMMDWKG